MSLYGQVVRNPVLVAFPMGIGARLAAVHCDHHVGGCHRHGSEDLGGSMAVSMTSRPWLAWTATGGSVSAAGIMLPSP
jgi:hypothetical protein